MNRLFILFLAALAAFTACDSSGGDDPDPNFIPPLEPADRPEPSTKNTVLVYLAIDNNFSVKTDYTDKVEAMRASWNSSLDGNLVVYCDAGIDKPVLVEILQSKKGYNYADTVVKYPTSHDSTSPEVFSTVLNEVKAKWPAEKYGLVYLSHATGWLPQGTLLRPQSVGSDWDDRQSQWKNEMELAEFGESLPYNLEYVIFDACFMGAAEVAYELKDKVKYVMGSAAEVVVPKDSYGFIYGTMMAHLMRDKPDVAAVAQEFYDYFANSTTVPNSATVSVIETAKMEAVAAAAKAILEGVDGEAEVDITDLQRFRPGNSMLYFDLGQYMSVLSGGDERYDAFDAALKAATVYKANTPTYYSAAGGNPNAITHFSGLSVYIPQQQYPFMNGEYAKLKWAKAAGTFIPEN